MIPFLVPALLLLGLLVLPILALYLLRLRRQEMVVSSTMLWEELFRDREANTPWQRLRRNILLILQLLILIALVVALARPFYPVAAMARGNVVILLDGSASMLATDITPTRFHEAKATAANIIADLRRNDQATLILVGSEPHLLAASTADRKVLNDALEQAQATPEEADWDSAIALAGGIVQGYEDAQVVILSDGGLPQDAPPILADVLFFKIGVDGANMAISALKTRESGTISQLFASVTNYDTEQHTALITITIDGNLQESRRIDVAGGGAVNLTWSVPTESRIISAQLTSESEDYLAEDNQAWTINEGSGQNRVLLISTGNRYLETIFSTLPGFQLYRASTDSNMTPRQAEAYDLVVYDGVPLPNPLPAVDMLIIDPTLGDSPSAASDLSLPKVTGIFSTTNVIRLTDSPILQHVDWSNVNIRQSQSVDSSWGEVLVEGEGGPLLMSKEINGKKLVLLTFALQDSDLPLQIAFPVLMANITSWLSPGQAIDRMDQIAMGDPVKITPDLDTEAIVIIKPDGSHRTNQVDESNNLFSETNQLGVYDVIYRSAGGERVAGHFVVNLLSPTESTISPRDDIRLGPAMYSGPGEGDIGQREVWAVFVILAFIILIIEWYLYHYGAKLPQWRMVSSRFRRNN